MELTRTINSDKRYYLDEKNIENAASFLETMRVFNDAKMYLYNALYDQKYLNAGPLLDHAYPVFLKEKYKTNDCNGVQREHNKKLNNGLPILHKVPPKRDYGRYFCIMAEKGGTSHGGLTEKLSPFFHAKKQEVNAYGR